MAERKNIIDAILAKVIASGAVGARAYCKRYDAPAKEDLPLAYVYGTEEEAGPVGGARNARTMQRILTVVIYVYAVETAALDIEAGLDAATTTIMNALDTDTTLASTVDDVTWISRNFEYDATGDGVIGTGQMLYNVTYMARENA